MALDLDALHVTSALCTASFVRFRCSSGASPQPRLADAASENSARPRDSAVRPRQTRPVSTTVRNLGTSRSRSSPATEPNRSPARPAPAGFSRLRSREASRQKLLESLPRAGEIRSSQAISDSSVRGASKRRRGAAAGAGRCVALLPGDGSAAPRAHRRPRPRGSSPIQHGTAVAPWASKRRRDALQ
jgi:hypothetical protein